MLLSIYEQWPEIGCDEAGRGCLAGPVVGAAVIFPEHYTNEIINDSKKLNASKRKELRKIIEQDALAFAVGFVDNYEIDKINILQASILAMHRALDQISAPFTRIIVDGNKFKPFRKIPHTCIIKGDGKFLSIAAASILAKTYRDEFMTQQALCFPQYAWEENKGYPTQKHRDAIREFGICPLHRISFSLLPENTQLSLF